MPIEPSPLSLVPVGLETASRSDRRERAGSFGCGWFDSSWDLRLGLEVRESSPAETHLFDWLDAFLASHASGDAPQRAFAVALPSSITAIA